MNRKRTFGDSALQFVGIDPNQRGPFRKLLPETSQKILDMLQTNERSLESTNSFGHLETGNRVMKNRRRCLLESMKRILQAT